MPPRAKKGQQQGQFIFVGGPALTDRKGPVRSQIFQQGHHRKKEQQRHDAAAEREALLRGEGTTTCTCYDDPALWAAQSQNPGYQAIRPKSPEPRGSAQGQCCSFCKKERRSQSQRQAVQLWDTGAGSFNPMIPINDMTSQLRVQEILNFAGTTIWPNFRPLGYSSNCYQFWAFPLDDEVKLYAVLWSASYHQDVLRLTYGGPDYKAGSKYQFRLKGLALESLRKEVSAYTGAKPIDSIIMCILFLAVNDSHGTRLYRDPSPFDPPFTTLHALDLYGSRDYHALHWTIIQDLLGKFGGVEALRTFALAWLLSIADIMNAAHTHRKPIYPCLGVDGSRLQLEPPLLLFAPFAAHFAQDTAGSGFNELLSMDPPVKQELVAAFSHIGQLSRVLQHYARQPCSPKALDLLGDCRNFVHHRLFSSPDDNEATEQILQHVDASPEAAELSRDIYLTCRLTLHLYANHVTFPIPRSTIVREPVLQVLCPKIYSLADLGVCRPSLLWCVCVAMVALDMRPGEQMLVVFKRLWCDLKLKALDDLLMLLRSFAWTDVAVEKHYTAMENIIKLW